MADSNNTDDKKELAKVLEDIALLEKDSTAKSKLKSVKYRFGILSLKNYETDKKSITLSEYDSLQKVLPDSEKDGFIVNKFERQNLFLKEKYNGDGRQILNAIINNFKHRFPQMLFISLPLFALLLKLLYIRRKKYLYVSHIIFSIHLYCAVFIIILISLWISSLATYINHSLASYINTGLILCCFFYLYKAIRYFYEQRRAKTMFKYFLLLLGSTLLMMILFVIFFIFSTLQLNNA
ncbi:MAG: hypothetical protein IPP48_10940 [Chitinophagaceae bacterium]|nr:hypothetical protein [Chitinophagaceae bacterium]